MSVPALTATAAPAATGALMCAVSLASSASAKPMLAPTAMQVKLPNVSLPKIDLPKLPEINLDLPNFGKKKEGAAAAKPKAKAPTPVVSRPPISGKVKIRPANVVQPSNPDAPSAPNLSGVPAAGVPAADQWKRFPYKRMPGANMKGFKDMAKGMKLPN